MRFSFPVSTAPSSQSAVSARTSDSSVSGARPYQPLGRTAATDTYSARLSVRPDWMKSKQNNAKQALRNGNVAQFNVLKNKLDQQGKRLNLRGLLFAQNENGIIDLINANLLNTDLRDAILRGANLLNAVLRGADLRGADLGNADLRGADLSNTDLGNADLSNTDLGNADLRHANLSNADLRGADLRHANLSNTDLSNTDLRGALLSRETG